MPKRFEFSAEFEHPVERVYAVLTDEAYWRGRLAPARAQPCRWSTPSTGTAGPLVTVTMTETVDSASFPALVRKAVRGEMRMQRCRLVESRRRRPGVGAGRG
ncbi:DUF2505 family protein, partial [Rhodococcus hoagii]|nr:DUF2505 family protein [Prescottella equi]